MAQTPSIKKNFLWNGLLSASNVLFPLLAFPYVSRILQPAAMGKVDFAASVVNYFIMFSALGIPTYGIRVCAGIREDPEKLSKTVHELFFINVITTAATAVFFITAVVCIPRLHTELTLFFITGINLLLNPLGMRWLYSAVEDYKFIAIRSISFNLVSLALIFFMIHSPEDYLKYAAINVLAVSGANIAGFFHAKKYVPSKPEGHCRYHYKGHMKSILVFFATSVAISIYTSLDMVMLGFISGDTQAGYYSAALKIRMACAAFVTILSNVLLPRLSYYAANGQDGQYHKLLGKSLNFALVSSVPLTVFFMIFSLPCIELLSGSGYRDAGKVLFCLMPSILFAGLSNVTGTQLLVPYRKEKRLFVSIIAGAGVDFLLNLFLIPRYGAAGAAMATSVAEFLVLSVQIMESEKTIIALLSRRQLLSIATALCVSVTVISFFKKVAIQSLVLYLSVNGSIFITVFFSCLVICKNPFIMDMILMLRKGVKK